MKSEFSFVDLVRGSKDDPHYCQRWRMVQKALRLVYHLPPKDYLVRWPVFKEEENERDKV